MQVRYYPDTDMMQVAFREKASTGSQEVSHQAGADYDEEGNVVGIEVEDASQRADLSSMQAFYSGR